MTCKILLLVCMLSVALGAIFARAADDFEAAVFRSGDQALPYRLLKPAGYDPQKKYPLVLFLHGAGERGDDNQAQLKHMVRIFAAKENREKYPCFVLVPQCPKNEKWSDVNWGASTSLQPEKPSRPLALAVALIGELEKKYGIDPARRYVMGLSMGGYGTWDAVVRYPGMFAAAVPVCGGGDETQAPRIAKLPIWVFHGDKDPAVKTVRSRNMVEAIRKAGGTPKYTEYPGVGHDSWTPASKEPELLPWLFSQKRP
ncbi:MAG: PHB depolymerase family esterase [Thermoguttaceae bacterium]|jgi:predicted peptidase